MDFAKSDRERSGVRVYRNGMNSKRDDLGQRCSGWNAKSRRRLKKATSKGSRKNARQYCRGLLGR